MRLINRSPYETRHLRRVVVAVGHAAFDGEPIWWKQLKVYVVLSGARVTKFNLGPRSGSVYIRVQKLTGDEWHQIARNTTEGRSLTTAKLAALVRAQLEQGPGLGGSWVVDPKHLSRLPLVVRLRTVKPKKEQSPPLPRDLLQERYARVLELEASWVRKQKLAGTKVKGYRKRRRYYEKRLAARKEG